MSRTLLTLLVLFATLASGLLQAQTISFQVTHATCVNGTGSITALVGGGVPPYTFQWTPEPPIGQGTAHITGLTPGVYSLTATGSNGFDATASTEVLATSDLFLPVTPALPIHACDGMCDATYQYFVPFNSANGPYTVTFDPPGPQGNVTPNGLFVHNLCPGYYMINIMDSNGCIGEIGPLEVYPSEMPHIISSTIAGSCPGGATGSMSLQFDLVDSLWVTGPDSSWLPFPTANPYVATNLAAGVYVVSGYTDQGMVGGNPFCHFTTSIEIPLSTDPCGSISGLLFADLDDDCGQAAIELGIPYRVLNISPGDHFVITDTDGSYATELFYGSYTLDASVDGYTSDCTTETDFDLSLAAPSATIDIPMSVLSGPDVSSFISAGVHRVGFPVSYTVSMNNEGPFPFSDLTLDLFFDPVLTFVSASGSPTFVAAGQLRWDVAALSGFGVEAYTVEFTVPANTALLGTVLNGTAVVNTQVPDSDPDNDSYTIERTVIGAYDPNDKLARTNVGRSSDVYLIDQDNYVDYTIRFQNTGSAEAINVFLLDTISADFDLGSLRILGASHPYEVSLLAGRVLRFDFNNIMLPDSTSDLLGSQGFASFRLTPMPGLEFGDHLQNAADIFFDFNEPIHTNTSDLVATFSVGIAEGTSVELRVYPNPVSDALMVQVPDGTWYYEVISMDGRIAARGQQSGSLLGLDASGLASGSYILRLVDGNSQVLNTRFAKQ